MGGTEVAGGVHGDERCVHSVSRPTVWACLEGVADFFPPLAGADLGQQGSADGVLFGRVGPVHCGQGYFVATLGSIYDAGPPVVVSIFEAGEQSVKRSLGGRFDLGLEVQFVPLAAAPWNTFARSITSWII
jgi:hypothetical protein